ncbi:MAG TPA: prepilin-type N-terminal cleavage/methylation domain-containing protein [Acidobacteriota bacterium]|nr:prepilin-type N-terminal cleavage/methylation domain-containing protein [Acidobacteriota bacterium]
MARHFHSTQNTYRQAGFSFMELLIGLLIFSILSGAILGIFLGYQKYRLHAASRNRLDEIRFGLASNMKFDIETGGFNLITKAAGAGSLGVVKDKKGNRQPAIFFTTQDSTNDTMIVLSAAQTGTGSVVNLTGSKLTINGVDPEVWKQFPSGQLLLCTDTDDSPVLIQLTGSPRKATQEECVVPATYVGGFSELPGGNTGGGTGDGNGGGPGRDGSTKVPQRPDLPPITLPPGTGGGSTGGGTGGGIGTGGATGVGILDPERTVVASFSVVTNCSFFSSIGTVPKLRGTLVPINQVVTYSISETGITRSETSGCQSEGQTAQLARFAPGYTVNLQFAYLVRAGGAVSASATLPSSAQNLVGVRVSGTLTDPTTRRTEAVQVDSILEALKPVQLTIKTP